MPPKKKKASKSTDSSNDCFQPQYIDLSDFKFIPFEGPNDESQGQKRKSVRSHVMRKFHDQRREKNRIKYKEGFRKSQTRNVPIGAKEVDLGGETLELSAPSLPDQGDLSYISPTAASISTGDGPAATRFGPLISPLFASQALSTEKYTHPAISQHIAILETFSSALSPSSDNTPFTKYWLPASMTGSMLFYASVFVSSASFETLSQKPLSATSYSNRGKAITLINSTLSVPSQCRSDELIAAVISLANFECVVGNISALKNHLDGLLQLADLRGGLHMLGMDGILSKLIRLYLSFLDIFSPADLSIDILGSTDEGYMLEVPPIASLFTMSDSEPGFISPEDPTFDILGNVYEKLLSGCHSASPNPSFQSEDSCSAFVFPHPSNYVYESLRFAYMLWDPATRWSHEKVESLVFALKENIEMSCVHTSWLPIPGALLWCLLVGMEKTRDDPLLYPYFASQILQFWTPLALHRWEGLMRALKCFGFLLKNGRKASSTLSDESQTGEP